jgi:hypothetical protein
MRTRVTPLGDSAAWDAALEGIPHAITHTHDYCVAIHETTRARMFLFSIEATDGRMSCPLAERGSSGATNLVTPYGIGGFASSGRCAPLVDGLRRFATGAGYVCAYISQHPLTAWVGFENTEHVVDEKALYLIDLRRPLDDVVARMSANRRRQVRSAEHHVAIEEGEAFAAFLVEQYAVFMERKHAALVYRFSRGTMEQLVRMRNVLTVGARGPTGIVSASVFGYTQYSAEFLFNAALPGYNHHSTALIWYAIRYFKRLGVPWLNLGGGIKSEDSLSEYKRRFGGETMALRSLRHVYDPPRYDELCRHAGVEPQVRSGWFPPFHAPGLVRP